MTRLLTPLVVLLAAVLLWRSFFSVDEGELALRTRLGQIQGEVAAPGLHLKSPFDELRRFDRRILTHASVGENFLTQDQKALTVDFYVKWQLQDVAQFFSATRGGDEEIGASRLADVVRERLRAAMSAAPLSAVLTANRGSLGDAGLEAAKSAANEMGVQLVDVQLQRIDLTDDEANAVYARMQDSLITQGQQLRADGIAQAEKIRTDADRKRADILADATRDAQHIRGEADAQAAEAYSKAYGHNAEFAVFYHSLQAYKNVFGREGDVLVLTPEGEFFKYLHSASGH